MIFHETVDELFALARAEAVAANSQQIDAGAIANAILRNPEARRILADALGIPSESLPILPENEGAIPSEKMQLARLVRSLLRLSQELADEFPDLELPGRIELRHFVCAASTLPDIAAHWRVRCLSKTAALARLESWVQLALSTPRVEDLTGQLRGLREELLTKVFGQDHAVEAFVEGLFNAELAAAADVERKRPQAIFVFAGPPGVGKTYLATLGAAALDRPFKRFDMTAFSGSLQHEILHGEPPVYRGSRPGELTGFVEQNPRAILLFDEIEKAHLNVVLLFLQILDNGSLKDHHHNRDVNFRDTILIFTTNAGKKLYADGNRSWGAVGRSFHRRTILSALEADRHPFTGEPLFPAPLISRLATGYPILFQPLGVNELERVVRAELSRVGNLLARQFLKQVMFGPLVSLALVLREGMGTDARGLRAQAETFSKTELFQLSQLFEGERLTQTLKRVDRIRYDVDDDAVKADPVIHALFHPPRIPKVLVIADPEFCAWCREHVPGVEWKTASRAEEAMQILGLEDIDLALFDIWLGASPERGSDSAASFDHVPPASHELARGQELLRSLHQRFPELLVYLLSRSGEAEGKGAAESVDDELLAACVRAGGVRGVASVASSLGIQRNPAAAAATFSEQVIELGKGAWREQAAIRLGYERKVLAFDTVPKVDEKQREIVIRLRNLRLARALSAVDAGEVLDDVERPRTRFRDVIGATDAKQELEFFIEFLRNPRRFAARGLKPPKGVLLHGPPGTGKTLLARAMAGESDVAFLPTSATTFVTIWQGSGPQSIRDLFARARRYAPAVIFIDEIDAIGKGRTGGVTGQAEENTLNALLTEMDGFTGPSPSRPVFILAATNFQVDSDVIASPLRGRRLDPALVRRFDRTIFVDLPDRAARREFLTVRLAGRPDSPLTAGEIDFLSERTTGMSLADVEAVLETAQRQALRAGEPISAKHLEEALERTRFGEIRTISPADRLRTARHEAGHALLYWLSGEVPSYVTVVSRGNVGGYMAHSSDDFERRFHTRADLEARLRTRLGGRAAEILYYGPQNGLDTGAANDLEQATQLARRMVCQFGMDDDFGPLAAPELLQSAEAVASPLFLQVHQAAGQIIRKQMEEALRLLTVHRHQLDALVERLIAKERVTRDELLELWGERK